MNKNPVILDDDKFEEFLEEWIENFSRDLHEAGGDKGILITVMEKYIEMAFMKSMGPTEIWDYFSISSPGIVDNFNFLKIKRDEVEKIFEISMNKKIEEWT